MAATGFLMSDAEHQLNLIFRISSAFRAGEQPTSEDRDAFRATIERFIAGESGSLEAAFGVDRNDAYRLRLERRNRQLVIDAEMLLPGKTDRQRATEIARKMRRYAGGAWQRERDLASCPAEREGTIEALCWRFLKANHGQPVGFPGVSTSYDEIPQEGQKAGRVKPERAIG
jgi:hypothetical protein